MKDQSPSVTLRSWKEQSSKVEPTALHWSSWASKKLQRRNSQWVKAVAVRRETLKRTPEKVQRSKRAPEPVVSVQSVS
ncbi:hypothetical protein [Streptomyces gougerotii]|uniref:hypothetical protein n=1 Tax=Streptomyces gougerotii TaxID=53448 RepID=UPI003FCC34BF